MRTIEYKITVEISEDSPWYSDIERAKNFLNVEFVHEIESLIGVRAYIEMSEVKPDNEVCNE